MGSSSPNLEVKLEIVETTTLNLDDIWYLNSCDLMPFFVYADVLRLGFFEIEKTFVKHACKCT